MTSYMARVNYSFMERYLLTASARWDGASVLAQGNKWDFFPSMALGWRMEQEEFMKDFDWLDQLKVRLGVGVTGNSAVSPYGTLGVISSYWIPFSTGNSQILVTNEPYYSSGSNLMPNKHLGWEKTTQWNMGFDFSVLKGRIGGTIDIYASRTKDLILNVSIPSIILEYIHQNNEENPGIFDLEKHYKILASKSLNYLDGKNLFEDINSFKSYAGTWPKATKFETFDASRMDAFSNLSTSNKKKKLTPFSITLNENGAIITNSLEDKEQVLNFVCGKLFTDFNDDGYEVAYPKKLSPR